MHRLSLVTMSCVFAGHISDMPSNILVSGVHYSSSRPSHALLVAGLALQAKACMICSLGSCRLSTS